MTRKISIIVIIAIAFFALLQCNVFAAETLPEAVNGVITLTEDVVLTGSATIDKTVTLNLNGHNITRSLEQTGACAILVTNPDAVLTIEGTGTVSAYGPAVWAYGGNVIIKDGTYNSDHTNTIYATGKGHIDIINGTFMGKGVNADTGKKINLLNLTDADRETASITVTGGTFIDWNPSDNEAEGEGTNFVAEGYKSVSDGSNFKVVKETAEDLFKKALNKGGTVKLQKDIELTSLINVSKTVTIDLNGHNITRSLEQTGACAILVSNTDAVLTIEGTGTVSAYGPAVWVSAGKAVIKGGTYNSDHTNTMYATGKGHIDIINGTFMGKGVNADTGKKINLLNLQDAGRETSSITVTGGTFIDWNPADNAAEGEGTNFVEDGYTAYGPDSNGYYKVCKHNLAKTEAKAATYTTDGNIEYYTCDVCKNMFKDSKGTQLTNASDVIIPMLIQISGGNASVDKVVVDTAVTESGNSSVVELPTVENATAVTVPVASLKEVEHEDKGLTVATKDTTVTLDAKAVEEVVKQAGSAANITIEVTKTEEKTLNKEQKEAIKDKEVAIVLSASILADGKEISNFNGGKVKVEIPFTPAEGTKGSDYKVYYIADDGKVTAVPTRYVKGNLVVELEHFSEYVVVKEVATAAPAPSAPAAAANPNEKDNTPKTGAISVIGLVIAMSVVGLAVLKRD